MLEDAVNLFPDIPCLRLELIESITAQFLDKSHGRTDEGNDRVMGKFLFVLEDTDFAAWYGTLLTPQESRIPCVLSQQDSVFPADITWEGLQDKLPPVYLNITEQPTGVCDTPLPVNAGVCPRSMETYGLYLVTVTNRTAFDYAFQETPITEMKNFVIYYDTDDGAALEQPLEELANSYKSSADWKDAGKYHMSSVWQDFSSTSEWGIRRTGMTLLVNVFSWGFTALVFLSVAVSVVGAMSADLAMHRREFALLRSAGMEQRQMDRFLCCQCFSYCAGLPVGIVLGAALCTLLSRLLDLSISNTFSPLIASAGAALLMGVSLLALHGARKSMARLSVVEALRGET